MAHPRHKELLELVDSDDVDGVLHIVTLDAIAQAWWRWHRGAHNSFHDPDWWAIELFQGQAIFEHRDLHRELLLELVAQASDEDELEIVGAGPLEDLVSDNEHFLRWVEDLAADNGKFRTALSKIWLYGDERPETLRRLEAAAGVPLGRSDPS